MKSVVEPSTLRPMMTHTLYMRHAWRHSGISLNFMVNPSLSW